MSTLDSCHIALLRSPSDPRDMPRNGPRNGPQNRFEPSRRSTAVVYSKLPPLSPSAIHGPHMKEMRFNDWLISAEQTAQKDAAKTMSKFSGVEHIRLRMIIYQSRIEQQRKCLDVMKTQPEGLYPNLRIMAELAQPTWWTM